MISVRARVRNGRLVVDEPTDLPEGSVVELGGDEAETTIAEAPPAEERLSPEEARELAELRRGPFVSHEDLRKRLAAQRR